jgi:hypothetical protein
MRYDQALPMAQRVADAMMKNPNLGPSHAETLRSRFINARILCHLFRFNEELAIHYEIAGAMMASPELGFGHEDTKISFIRIQDLEQQISEYPPDGIPPPEDFINEFSDQPIAIERKLSAEND